MKCEFCGSSITLEDKKCPFCGKENRHAQQHIKDMEQYKENYYETKKEVYRDVHTHQEITSYVVVIVILILLVGVLFYGYKDVYQIVSSVQDVVTTVSYPVHRSRIDEYIEDGNYLAIPEYIDEKGIQSSYQGPYKKYRKILQKCEFYSGIYYKTQGLISVIIHRENAYLLSEVQNLVKQIRGFYLDEEDMFDGGVNEKVYVELSEEMLRLLHTYYGLSEEECSEVKDLNDKELEDLILEKVESIYGADIDGEGNAIYED